MSTCPCNSGAYNIYKSVDYITIHFIYIFSSFVASDKWSCHDY